MIAAGNELVRIEDLTKVFPLKQPILDVIARKPKQILQAVDHVNLSIMKGETLGLVGESGCGKSTLAKTMMRLYNPDGGKMMFEGEDLASLKGQSLRDARKKFQMIFQDPYSSLNPRMSVRDMLTEILTVHKICPKSEIDDRIGQLLETVGMSIQMAERFPGEFSGGQRQRLGIARALALNPTFIIADEPVSALDVSIQAQVINLLRDIQQSLQLTMLFISHDLRVVRYITNRVAVMYLGKIIELGETEELFRNPYHPYTKVLIKAAPVLDPRIRTREYAIEGEPPSPIHVPEGCKFHPRCPYAKERCKSEPPKLSEVQSGRMVACHYPLV
ncbi:ABC transporter ATP-binding protein [Paenibacillus sp. GP183]|jgi:oligopeptide/dipeptide ABC transporter ATP-binding protein|uniref:ABC transporter ATP-binding protein n=1 Tax=Paenibacillus sp. GP183 TaxID=1882751 RepID=UPI000896A4B3|nr:ABC transporter ATP-binding protein [Paenibacillus sp. GP183]SEB84436.1 peptide/nickel transport system ATP-binding protein/oligopeptide transport system ATP-binding protein [Paenibacillus sp. GP183]